MADFPAEVGKSKFGVSLRLETAGVGWTRARRRSTPATASPLGTYEQPKLGQQIQQSFLPQYYSEIASLLLQRRWLLHNHGYDRTELGKISKPWPRSRENN